MTDLPSYVTRGLERELINVFVDAFLLTAVFGYGRYWLVYLIPFDVSPEIPQMFNRRSNAPSLLWHGRAVYQWQVYYRLLVHFKNCLYENENELQMKVY